MSAFFEKPRAVAFAVAALLVTFGTACIDDPYEAKTWIKKLDDVRHWEEAVLRLERLKDPTAIEALGVAWKKRNKDGKILRAIISLAELPPEWNGPAWDKAVPILREALDTFDPADRESFEDARIAADALGRAKDPRAVESLLRAANLQFPKLSPKHALRTSAIKSLGNFGSDPAVIESLIKILGADDSVQPPQVNAAAANALAQTRDKQALQPLLLAAYAQPRIFGQVRNAITRLGPVAEAPLKKILNGKHVEVNAMAKEKKLQTNCDKAQGPGTDCTQPGVIDLKAAVLLGDLRAESAVSSLVAKLNDSSLKEPAASVVRGAALDALRKISAPSSSKSLYDFMVSGSTDDKIRPGAIEVYSIVASGREALPWLEKQMKSDKLAIKQSSTVAYARLASTSQDLIPIDAEIAKREATAQKAAAAAESAPPEGKDAANRKVDEAKNLITAFKQFRARIQVGMKCKGDPSCYAEILEMDSDAILAMLGITGETAKELGREGSEGYRLAVLERSLLDIGKTEKQAKAAQAALLKVVDSTERIVRMGALAGMIKGSPDGCDECVTRLDEIIKAQEGRNTLAELTVETRVVRNYFLTRQKNTPAAPAQ